MIGSTLSAVEFQSQRGIIASRLKNTISKIVRAVNFMCVFVTISLLSVLFFCTTILKFRHRLNTDGTSYPRHWLFPIENVSRGTG